MADFPSFPKSVSKNVSFGHFFGPSLSLMVTAIMDLANYKVMSERPVENPFYLIFPKLQGFSSGILYLKL